MTISKEDEALRDKYDRLHLVARFENLEDEYYESLISDEELKKVIEMNNDELRRLIVTEKPSVERIREVFFRNINFYRLANYRSMSIHDKGFMFAIATELGEDLKSVYKDLYDEELDDRRQFCQASGHSYNRRS